MTAELYIRGVDRLSVEYRRWLFEVARHRPMAEPRTVVEPVDMLEIEFVVNGRTVQRTVPVRQLLSDFLRDDLRLTGTHVGCEHGVCGACTVDVDGAPVRACIMLAVQADGKRITTVEGLAHDGQLTEMQAAPARPSWSA